ncbi:hypothetical protein NP493_780g01025 [Ridgeia piscesae]|uniref:Uncharacterized protein n=1 Tax=Ridgeia piscesae TaxID=27915 RepID=A0AAD9KNC7_RIDPI|nr:hypothetical protein NP493_780g01025 [Ridgeia piscesae]
MHDQVMQCHVNTSGRVPHPAVSSKGGCHSWQFE